MSVANWIKYIGNAVLDWIKGMGTSDWVRTYLSLRLAGLIYFLRLCVRYSKGPDLPFPW